MWLFGDSTFRDDKTMLRMILNTSPNGWANFTASRHQKDSKRHSLGGHTLPKCGPFLKLDNLAQKQQARHALMKNRVEKTQSMWIWPGLGLLTTWLNSASNSDSDA